MNFTVNKLGNVNLLNNTKILYVISLFIILFYLSPFFLYSEDLYIQIYDNLDSNHIWLKILAESGMIFSDSIEIIPNMMSGLPRLSYGTEYNALLWLYVLFEPFTAYSINEVILHIFAFFSMLILLKRYFIKETTLNRNLIIFTSSLLFSLVPFWPSGGLGIPSIPLVSYSFLNIFYNKDTKKDWIILFLIPFYSIFILSYFFYLLLLILFIIYLSIKHKKVYWNFLSAILFMTTIFLLIDYRLISAMFVDNHFISHRTEFLVHKNILIDSYKLFILDFFNGNNNQISAQFPFVIAVSLSAYLLSFNKRKYTYKESITIILLFSLLSYFSVWHILLVNLYTLPIIFFILLVTLKYSYEKKIAYILLTILILSAWSGFWFSEELKSLFPNTLLIEKINFSRFTFLQPFFWYLLLVAAFIVISNRIKFSSLIIPIIAIFILSQEFKDKYFIQVDEDKYEATYRAYYAKKLFTIIDKYIDKDKSTYRVGSIGLEPAVSLYNGFYTIDGYSANYPLEYKHTFNKILQSNLYTNKSLKPLFTEWGSKCYLFGPDASLTYSFDAGDYNRNTQIPYFVFDIETLRELQTKYIFSAYEIIYPDPKEIKLLRLFTQEESYWDIYLYQIQYPTETD